MSSDALLYLDLDHENALMSNGAQSEHDGTETPAAASQGPRSPAGSREPPEKPLGTSTDDLHAESVACPQKKVIKPPMPPTKETKPSTPEVEAEKETFPTKRVCRLSVISHDSYRSGWTCFSMSSFGLQKLLELRADGFL